MTDSKIIRGLSYIFDLSTINHLNFIVMTKKIDLLTLSKNALSEKEKSHLLGGDAEIPILGCCCGGHGMVNTWNQVRQNQP